MSAIWLAWRRTCVTMACARRLWAEHAIPAPNHPAGERGEVCRQSSSRSESSPRRECAPHPCRLPLAPLPLRKDTRSSPASSRGGEAVAASTECEDGGRIEEKNPNQGKKAQLKNKMPNRRKKMSKSGFSPIHRRRNSNLSKS